MNDAIDRRPNILLVMADQLSGPIMSFHGGPAITPNIDRLAAEGVTFTSMYNNSPLCAPARFSMMSGQLNSKIGAYDNASEFAASVPTFAHHLRAVGYQTSLVGKMHFVGPDQLHGFEDRLTTDIYPADFGWTPNWNDPDSRIDWWFHNMDSVVNAGVADVSNQLDFDDDVAYQAVRKVRDLARSTDDRPWMMTISFTHPHDPYVARREFWDLYTAADIPMPTTTGLAHGNVAVDPHSRRLRRLIAADTTAVTDAQIRDARHAYLANISYIDHQMGNVLATLERHGMADDTIVVFTSDHGDMLGERDLWYKMSFFEHSARVPLVVHAPARFQPGRNRTHASLLDLAPTLLDMAEIDPPATMDGGSLLPFIAGKNDPERTIVGEYFGEGAIAPIFMLRRGVWKYVWSQPDPPQLFNIDEDPHEVVNLAGDPEHAAIADSFLSEISERWDPDRLDAEVRASQQARSTVDGALRQGRFASWDYQPTTDAAGQYMRNHLDLNDVESTRRA